MAAPNADGPFGEKLSLQDRCCCRSAVLRAYNGMTASGTGAREALDAATRVYRFHHPEVSAAVARHTVENWVYNGRIH